MNNYFKLDALTAPISTEDGLKHAVLQSIYNHAISTHNDRARMRNDERGGCWSDAHVDNVGSRDWTLGREKLTEQTIQRARKFYTDALQWLLDKNHVKDIEITVKKVDPNRMQRDIKITLLSGEKVVITA